MFAFIILALLALVALTVFGFALHLLFSPWLLVAIGVVALIKFWPRRARR